MVARHRLLVALLIGGSVATEIDGIRRALGSNQLERIAPHVTLIPPTNVADEAVGLAERVVRDAAGSFEHVALTLGPPDTFPDNRSVLFLAVSAVPSLGVLRASLLSGPFAGRDEPERVFVPHVTLDSRKEPFVDDKMLRDLASYKTSLEVVTLALLAQDETAPLHAWRTLTSYDFAPARLVGRGGLEVCLNAGVMLSPSTRALVASWGVEPPAVVDARSEYFVVASVAAEIVAAATWRIDENVVVLTQHAVAPAWRRVGIGTKVLSFVEDLERTRARRDIVLAPSFNDGPDAYYEGRGFRREERVRRFDGVSAPLVRRLTPGSDAVD